MRGGRAAHCGTAPLTGGWMARGYALGTASHGIGAARALQVNADAGACAGARRAGGAGITADATGVQLAALQGGPGTTGPDSSQAPWPCSAAGVRVPATAAHTISSAASPMLQVRGCALTTISNAVEASGVT